MERLAWFYCITVLVLVPQIQDQTRVCKAQAVHYNCANSALEVFKNTCSVVDVLVQTKDRNWAW